MELIKSIRVENYEVDIYSDNSQFIKTTAIEMLLLAIAVELDIPLRITADWRETREVWDLRFRWPKENDPGWHIFKYQFEEAMLHQRGLIDPITPVSAEICRNIRRVNQPSYASWQRIGEMVERGEIAIPRSGYFEQFVRHWQPSESAEFRARLHDPVRWLDDSAIQLLQELPQERTDRIAAVREALTRTTMPMEPAPQAVIGDTTCKNNAKSPYLRCAINPCGPCEGCTDYHPH